MDGRTNGQIPTRIVGHGEEDPEQLLANPHNFRRHPGPQLDALRGSLRELGWVKGVLVNRTTGHVVDGHARVEEALRQGQRSIPVDYIDLTEQEERLALAVLDPITEMATRDDAQLRELLDQVETGEDGLKAMLDEMLAEASDGGAGEKKVGTLAERFGIPPFSVLDARSGYWQDRKRAWISLGIESEFGRESDLGGLEGAIERREALGRKGELTWSGNITDPDYYRRKEGKRPPAGRKDNLTFVKGDRDKESLDDTSKRILGVGAGTSIFDPVLCELVYRWFCPPEGLVLDPFAGGSVRGVVAAKLGRCYVGVDLRPEQVEANRRQAADIGSRPAIAAGLAPVRVSAAMARLRFAECDPGYIATVCRAACCRSSTDPSGTRITVHPTEEDAIRAHGGEVRAGMLQPVRKRCPFQARETELCDLHGTDDKPFGCVASPFTLNENGTLIVRNRYRLLRCYEDGAKVPAYKAFRASLDRIFGAEEAARICAELDGGSGDIHAAMPIDTYRKLIENDVIKKGGPAPAFAAPVAASKWIEPVWVVGDSREELPRLENDADFVFSCPPYADLEVYSDDPRDLSTMVYGDFLAAYREVIAKSCARLRPDRFACFTVGDIRDPSGYYRNFVSDTITAFRDAGLELYNEAILVTMIGSLPLRAGGPFRATRKLGKTHQNVLVFVKGDAKRATEAIGEVEFAELEEKTDGREGGDGEPDQAA